MSHLNWQLFALSGVTSSNGLDSAINSDPMAWGPPNDRRAAVAVVREAVRLGINHIDTSDYYGPPSPMRSSEALHPIQA
jgi:aryl-alcohol dehydrogenase-like predicted oxidoreductase